MEFVENVLIVLGFVAILLLAVAVIGLLLLTVLDVFFRVDIGISKLVWATMVVMAPGLGMLVYWLFRPKRFNPLLETEDVFVPAPRPPIRPAPIAAAAPVAAGGDRPARPAPTLIPARQGGSDPELIDDDDEPTPPNAA